MKTSEDVTLRDLCKQAVEKHPSVEDAIKTVKRMLGGHPEIQERLMDNMLAMAIRETIYQVRGFMRGEVKAPIQAARDAGAVASITPTVLRSILDWWRVGDKRLGDLTGDELLIEAQEESAQAHGHQKNARFYQKLAATVPSDETVRAHVDADTAKAMWDEIERGKARQSIPANHTENARQPRRSNKKKAA
jgi:hypothetical protein